MIRYGMISTPWGHMLVAERDGRLCGATLPGTPAARLPELARRRWPGAERDDSIQPRLRDAIDGYFDGRPTDFDCTVDLSGISHFHRRVLEACRTVSYGHTATYSQLATLAGNPKAVRAAGGAMARNPIPLIIPCHRILRSDGGLGGFSAECGVDLKQRLLAWEAQTRTAVRAAHPQPIPA